jgi:hypothetical protein
LIPLASTRERIVNATGVSLRLFSPIPIVIGEEFVPSKKPVKFRWFSPFQMSPTIYVSLLQILGWILIPLLVASLNGWLKWQ